MSTVVERVAAGYQWLCENRPQEMAGIDPDRLNVASADNCPLGQIGGYWETLNMLIPKTDDMESPEWLDAFNAQTEWAVAHGFQVSTDDMEDAHDEYGELNGEWRRVLGG